jgi:hypothetical protein
MKIPHNLKTSQTTQDDYAEYRCTVIVLDAQPPLEKQIALDNAKKIRGVFHPNPPRCKGIRK